MKTNKQLITALLLKCEEMDYELTTENLFYFERECINICAIRAGGIDKVDDYLEEHGLRKACHDYERDPDNGYYEELIELFIDAANQNIQI